MSNPGVRDVSGSPDGTPKITALSDTGGLTGDVVVAVENKLITKGAQALAGALPTSSQSDLAKIVVSTVADIFTKLAGNPTLVTNAINATVTNNVSMLGAQLRAAADSVALTELARMRKVAAQLYKMEGEQKANRDLVHAIATDLLEGAMSLALAGVGL